MISRTNEVLMLWMFTEILPTTSKKITIDLNFNTDSCLFDLICPDMTDKLLTMQEVKHFSNALAFVMRSNWITVLLQIFATISSDIDTLRIEL